MFTYTNSVTSNSVLDGPKPVLRNFEVSVRLDGQDELRLALQSCEQHKGADPIGAYVEYDHLYQDSAEAKEAVVRLKLRCYETAVLAFVEGEVLRENDFGNHRSFAPDGGIVIHIGDINEVAGVMANYQHKDWWTRPYFDPDLRKLPERTLSLLWQTEASYYQLLPVSGPVYRADLRGRADAEGNGISVVLSSFQGGMTSCNTFAFILGGDNNPYDLVERNVSTALRQLNTQVKPRTEKAYPEVMDYLGWCSWDAFYHQVDEQGLLEKAEEFNKLGLPVRWVMIDDGWSEIKDRKLSALDAEPAKFPNGLYHTVEKLKEKHGVRWVGVWHTIAGYWNGIDPNSELAKQLEDYLFTTHRGNVIPYPDAGRGFGFWHAWHGYLARQGIDFVKVDSQSAVHNFLRHHQPIGVAAAAAHEALEASVTMHFDRTIINCMGMAAENIWHRPVSAVSRNSDDFVPNERHGFKEHALQNGYNSYYHGAFYWGDWDMFWTENHDDVQNMVLRAISGGPIYFSDPVGRTDPAKLWPLVYKDGKIIRCDRTANPTPDCLTRDPLAESIPLKLWNTAGGAGIVAAFHISEQQAAVRGSLSMSDVPELSAESVWVYEYFSGSLARLHGAESLEFSLQDEQSKLFSLYPVQQAVTPIGLINKLIASDAIQRQWMEGSSTFVQLREGGIFAFICEQSSIQVRLNGQSVDPISSEDGMLYKVDCTHIEGELTIEIVAS